MATKKQVKGDVGKKTGGTTRAAIKAAEKKGLTLEQIGKKVNRSGGTISAISNGDIKNPPKGLAAAIRKIKAPAKKKPAKKHK